MKFKFFSVSLWLCVAFNASAKPLFAINNDTILSDSVKAREKYLFGGLLDLIGKAHYAPPAIDDSLSKHVFDIMLKRLDPDKSIFLQSDVDTLARYKYSIDEEIIGRNELAFYYAVRNIYLQRIKELKLLPILVDESRWTPLTKKIKIANGNDIAWSSNASGRLNRWDELLTYQYLLKQLDLQKGFKSEKERSEKAKKSLHKKYAKWITKNTTDFSETAFFAQYLNVICDILDPHTEYQPPVDKRKFDQMMSNAFFGIGLQIAMNDQQDFYAKTVMRGMSAWKDGRIKEGSVFLAIAQGKDGAWEDIDGLDMQELVDRIRGKEGSIVKLRLKEYKTGNVYEVALPREKVNIAQAAARSTIIKDASGKKIGFLFLPEFYNDFNHADGAKSADDVLVELKALNKEGIDALIVDLRNNGGGSLSDVVKIGGYFIPQGPIVQVRDRNGNVQPLVDTDSTVVYNGPLAILVNGQSASASEIFTAAMQDYKRAVVIGTDSYGKGTVQRQLPLGKQVNGEPEFGAIKLTFQKFYRINGGTTQLNGVTPDVFMPDRYNYFKYRERNQDYPLSADSVPKALYEPYVGAKAWTAATNNLETTDQAMAQLDSLTKAIATPMAMWTNDKEIESQYSMNKKRFEQLKTLESVNTTADWSFMPMGKYQNEDWYKDWIKSLQKSRFVVDVTKLITHPKIAN